MPLRDHDGRPRHGAKRQGINGRASGWDAKPMVTRRAAAPPDPVHDPHTDWPMSEAEFRRVAERAQSCLGIELRSHKQQMIRARLSRRLRALGLESFNAYLELLDQPEGAAEEQHFANAITTNLTAFFRESHHFDHFERSILLRGEMPAVRRLRVWSAGCSTGEEAYSIAMVVRQVLADSSGWDVRILATDLDTAVLGKAARGCYPPDRLKSVPPRFRTPAFLRIENGWVVPSEEIRALISFRRLNLIDAWPMRGPFDAIFCRNVLIYFSAEIKERIIEQFADMLRPGGILYLGHSESILGVNPRLSSEGHTIYRRAGG
jgi:chemotaxis protein methyltransferase CheR